MATRLLPGGGAVQDAAGVVGRRHRGGRAGPCTRARWTRARWWPCRAPGSGPAPCRSTRTGCRSATASCGSIAAAGRTAAGRSAGRWPATRRGAAARWIRRSGGAPSTSGADPIGHILFIEHDEPAVARRARWYLEPVDYLAMRFTGVAAASHASMAGAWLDRQPRPRPPRVRPGAGGGGRRPGRQAPPLRPTGAVVGEVRAEVAGDLGLGPGVVVVTGTPDLHSAAVGSGAVLEAETHLAISTTSWVSCPVDVKKTDPIRQIATVPGLPARRARATWWPTTTRPVAGPSSGCATCCSPRGPGPARQLRRPDGGGGRCAGGSGGVLFTPWLAGERSPVDDRNARGGFHNLSLGTEPARPGAGRPRRGGLQQPLAGRGGGALHGALGSSRSGWWGAGPPRLVVPDPRRRARPAGRAGGRPGRRQPAGGGPVGRPLPRPPRSPASCGRWWRPTAPSTPTRAPGPTYDRLYAEFPKLYAAQKPMFARLNRRA